LTVRLAYFTNLASAELVADDDNPFDITVTSISAAPGVTAPSNQTGVTGPVSLFFTGSPTAPGNFTYNVHIIDGFNSENFTVTVVADPDFLRLGTEGSGNSFPFNFSNAAGRFQTAYDSTDLGLPVGTVISKILVAGSTIATVPEYSGLQIRIGTTSLDVG